MDNYNYSQQLTEELVAAWIDGTLPPQEDSSFVEMLSTNEELSAILDSYDEIESDFEFLVEEGIQPPEDINDDFELPTIETGFFDDSTLMNFESDSTFEAEEGIYNNLTPSGSIENDDEETADYIVDDNFDDPQEETFDII